MSFSFQTEGLESQAGDSVESQKSKRLRYVVERDVEVIDEDSKRSSLWKCVGNGVVEIKRSAERKAATESS